MSPVGPRVPVTPSGARTWRRCPRTPATTVALGVSNPGAGGWPADGVFEVHFPRVHSNQNAQCGQLEGADAETAVWREKLLLENLQAGQEGAYGQELGPRLESFGGREGTARRPATPPSVILSTALRGVSRPHRTGPGGQGSRTPGSSRQGTKPREPCRPGPVPVGQWVRTPRRGPAHAEGA